MYINTKNHLVFAELPALHHINPRLALPITLDEPLPDGSLYTTVFNYFDKGISAHVNAVVKSHNFDDISRCALVKDTSPFYASAQSLITWYNAVWTYVAQEQAKLDAGEREFAPLADFITELPTLEI